MKKIIVFLMLSLLPLTVFMILSCSSEQRLASIAKDYLIEQGNNISSVTINPGKEEGYYDCEAATIGLIEGYLVHEIWQLSFDSDSVVSAVKQASTDSTILTKMDSGEQITLREYYQSALFSWIRATYEGGYYYNYLSNLYSLSDLYLIKSGKKSYSCYDAVLGLCNDIFYKGYEVRRKIKILLQNYKLYSWEFIDGDDYIYDNDILINMTTGEEITYKQYERKKN